MSRSTATASGRNAAFAKAAGFRPSRGLAILLGVPLVAAAGFVASPASAGIKEWALGAIGWLVMIIIQFLGWLIISVIPVLVSFASYNTFVTHSAVGVGWSVMRDVVNMFFVLILLFMAFGTMLGFSNWTARGGKLVNLLIMAVLVNFSRTICGIVIDMGQVIMLTFVSGFKEAAGGNFLEAMKLTEVLKMAESGQAEQTDTVVALIMAMIMTAIALFVIVMMTIALAVRIVQLWLLIVISPIAFFLRGAPVASNYYGEWWKQFSNTVIVGPLLAFFLWLSLVSVQSGNIGSFSAGSTGETYGGEYTQKMAATFANETIAQFIIACGLLLMGYKLANSMASQTMGVASKIRQGGAQMGRWAARQSMRAGAAAGGAAVGAAGRIQLAAGKEIRNERGEVIGREKVAIGALARARYEQAKKGIVTSRAGRLLGLDKEYTETRKKEERIKALEATSQVSKARSEKQAALREMSGKYRDLSGEELRTKFEEAEKKRPGSLEFKALALRMAEEGEFKGRPDLIRAKAGNDKVLLKMLQDAAKAKGDPFADLDVSKAKTEEMADAMNKRFAEASQGERARMAYAAADGIARGADGKAKSALAADALQAIDEDTFKKFSAQLKNRLKEALTLAVNNGEMSEAAKTAKLQEWGTEDLTDEQKGTVLARQDEGVIQARMKLMEGGNVGRAFGSFDAKSGNFRDASQAAEFERLMKRQGAAAKLAGKADTKALTENDGMNDLSLGIMSNLDVAGAVKIARTEDAKKDNFFAAVQAAQGISKKLGSEEAIEEEAKSQLKREIDVDTADQSEIDRKFEEIKGRLRKAAENAKQIADEYENGSSTLRKAAGNISRTAGARRFIGQTANQVAQGAILPAAVVGGVLTGGMAGAAIAGGGYAISHIRGRLLREKERKMREEAMTAGEARTAARQELIEEVRAGGGAGRRIRRMGKGIKRQAMRTFGRHRLAGSEGE